MSSSNPKPAPKLQPKQLLAQSTDELGFDPDALRKKYNHERDKRIKKEGNAQYSGFEGDFESLTEDTFTPEKKPRAAVSEDINIVIVGGGHCGLLTAANLIKKGITDFKIIDGAADFGGTWYWNRYPGIRCDTEAYIYMPLLEETGYVPSEKYASGQEIFEHTQRIGRHFSLYEKAYFQTHVEIAQWHETESRWHIKTDRGDQIKANYVVMALGPLNKPRLPGIPGLDAFKGHMFHTSRWDYDYTGGSSDDMTPDLSKLSDKRVGIIGTGCTGLQCAPHVAKYAKQLHIFQRTPAAVGLRNNHPTDLEWAKSLKPGWQAARSENFAQILLGQEQEEDLVQDGWTNASEIFAATFVTAAPDENSDGEALSPEDQDRYGRLIDYQKMEVIRNRVSDVVSDSETAEKLKPWYRLFCKRPAFSDNYLPIFNQANVNLVDTEGQGVDKATTNGLVANGTEYPLDCIIFASGYEVNTDYCRRGDLKILGSNGHSLSDYWAEGPKTLYGYLSNGFPNLLHVGPFLGNPVSANFTTTFMILAEHVAKLLDHIQQSDNDVLEATADAEQAWGQEIRDCFDAGKDYYAECTPGYYNAEGDANSKESLTHDVYSPGPYAFEARIQEWFDNGLPGVTLR